MPRGKPAVKEVIDAHFHRPGLAPGDLSVKVRDRKAGSGLSEVPGAEIAGVRGGFIDLADGGRVPLHRVVEVRSKGRRVWPP